jgi:hypothetical protein
MPPQFVCVCEGWAAATDHVTLNDPLSFPVFPPPLPLLRYLHFPTLLKKKMPELYAGTWAAHLHTTPKASSSCYYYLKI